MQARFPLLAAFLAACQPTNVEYPDGGLQCGPGTHEEDGWCVVDDDADTSSGADTAGDTDTGPDTDTGGDTDTGTASYTVCDDGVAPYTSIQAAIDAAVDGDTILICAGTYEETLSIVDKNVSLEGEDRDTTIVDANRDDTVLTISGDVGSASVSGLTLTGGDTAGNGGGVLISDASPTLSELLITGNRAAAGAGVFISESDAVLDDIVIMGCDATGAGGGIRLEGLGSSSLSHLWVEGNTAEKGPGGLDLQGGLDVLANSVVFANTGTAGSSSNHFAAIIGGFGDALVFNNVFSGNLDPTHNTRANPAVSFGGGSFYNNIVYGNQGFGLDRGQGTGTYEYNLSYSNTHGKNWGEGNLQSPGETDIETDPRFVDAENGDFTLEAGFSPAIDKGNPQSGYNDVDGTRNDMGAFGGSGGEWVP